jgi:hypothetical protein
VLCGGSSTRSKISAGKRESNIVVSAGCCSVCLALDPAVVDRSARRQAAIMLIYICKYNSICSIRFTGKPSPCLSWGNTRLQLTTRLGATGFLVARTQGVFIRDLHLAPASVSPDPISRTRWLSISTGCGRTLVLQRTRRNLFGPWPRSCHQRMAGRSSQTWNHRKQSCVSIS